MRSTWLRTSVDLLRERGLLERYVSLVPMKHREAILTTVAGAWLPIDVAMAHYNACDQLGMSVAEQFDMGSAIATRNERTSLLFGMRLARASGATPWTAFAQQQRMWEHAWRGGGVSVSKLGPKEARAEIVAWPCATFAYCRNTLRGILKTQVELFCNKAYVTQLSGLCSATSVAYRIAWA